MNQLNGLDAWKEGASEFSAPKSAQGYLRPAVATAACGSSCGAGDADEKEETPAACGASCGAADDGEKEETPAACGASCGAGD